MCIGKQNILYTVNPPIKTNTKATTGSKPIKVGLLETGELGQQGNDKTQVYLARKKTFKTIYTKCHIFLENEDIH